MSDVVERAFVLEVDGRATLAFAATTLHNARQLPKEAWLIDDLAGLRSDGKPLWVSGQAMSVRQASEEERWLFDEGKQQSPDNDEMLLVYLIELDD